ncbi:hypothetical protein PVL29_017781 [Vitis rotundifolia]|uniref:Disease resistance N-terminal domain-containing protein n=1 Tax=Vitis rotundifolia TaxID=103349 RepID=A0AA38ZBA3_VITRO|nr:hypothetical protein PVL29_017781 [Vitis rotundifolia]
MITLALITLTPLYPKSRGYLTADITLLPDTIKAPLRPKGKNLEVISPLVDKASTDALLSASLQVLFDRLASPDLINFIGKLLVVHKALNDAEMKQFSDPLVKDWLVQVKDVVYHAEDLLVEIATETLRCQIEAAEHPQTGGIYQV